MSIIFENEKLIKKFHPSRWHFWQMYFAAGIVPAAAAVSALFPGFLAVFGNRGGLPFGALIVSASAVLGFMIFGLAEILRIAHTYYVTDKRIIEGFSFLSRRFVSTPHSRIQNFEVGQSLLGRVVNIGDLEFYTAGSGGARPEIAFRGVKDPIYLKKIIGEIKLKEISAPAL